MSDPRHQTARAWGAGVLATLSCILLPLALLSMWVAAVVTNTDRYVDTVAPLADDPAIQRQVEDRLESAIVDRIDLDAQQQRAIDALGENSHLGRLVPVLRPLLTRIVEDTADRVVHRIVSSADFATAWENANRSAHEELVAVLSGEDSDLVTSDGRVSIQLATVVNAIVDELADRGLRLASRVPDAEASFTLMQADDLEKAEQIYGLIDALGFWLPVLTVLLAGGAIALARGRRRTLQRILIGYAAGGVVLGVALHVARNLVLGGLGDDTDPEVARAVWDILTVDLRLLIRVALVLVIVAMLTAWISGPSRSAVSLRSAGARVRVGLLDRGADRGLVMGGGAVILVLIVLIWVV